MMTLGETVARRFRPFCFYPSFLFPNYKTVAAHFRSPSCGAAEARLCNDWIKPMKISKANAILIWKQIEDDLSPRLYLTVTERVVYSHLLRHSRLEGKLRLRFSILWLMRGARLSAAPARQAVRRLVAKGALRLVERTRAGHVVEVRLPDEIRADPPDEIAVSGMSRQQRRSDIEQMDFLQTKSRRAAIHARDRGLCFYCLRRLTPRVRCLDHVVPLARMGRNSYRNLVSSCVECNTQKGETVAEDFLRGLYRDGRLTAIELTGRLRAVEALAAGKLRPALHSKDAKDD
jgi:5-methylcytosine-specific restriction endonuclease McrA